MDTIDDHVTRCYRGIIPKARPYCCARFVRWRATQALVLKLQGMTYRQIGGRITPAPVSAERARGLVCEAAYARGFSDIDEMQAIYRNLPMGWW